MKTVYNVRHRLRVLQKDGRSQVQQRLGELAKHKYIEHHRGEEGSMTVTDLFWAHPRACFDVIHQKKLALMNAIDNTFLNARHLLCPWHINKNVLTKYKKICETKEKWDKFNTAWNYLILSSTEEEYNDHLAILHEDFSNYSEAIKYATSKRANSVGIDVAACGCVLRCTHGLPCAHEIADYMRQGRSIPLTSIHVEKLELTCIPELEMILKRFNESDIATQLDMLKKLREIANPASTFLIEPNSILASSQSKKKRASKVHEKKWNVKTKTYRTRKSLPSAYAGDFSPMLIPFIKLMKDVDGDGNCDFRAIAGLLGHGQNDYVKVKHDLLLELNNHRDKYIVLYRSHERVEEPTHILSYFEDSPGFDRWMTMPDMGHLIASFYNVVLYHLALQQCLTFLPLRSPPVTLADRREIAIGFVNGNHFV
ncbi:uncharacterized protein LOC114323155 [Camellia sinensis]|uniref:uncharacterized protein LOC114323155 n=1 Tax=Camellia sinensis TaxID=4442 RepID=UPI001035CB42|nr:uncharacterized protein LOC114323155 [Camellia sinensis]